MKNTNRVYYDLEFIEGPQTERFLGIELRKWNYIAAYFFCIVAFALVTLVIKKYLYEPEIPLWIVVGSTLSGIFTTLFAWNSDPKRWVNKPTIDIISIGMVRDDGQEYYAISKDFNLREAWERCDIKDKVYEGGKTYQPRIYWIRENVLKPIFKELSLKERTDYAPNNFDSSPDFLPAQKREFNYKNLKRLINKYGKTNAEIATEVERFCKVLNPITPADKPLYQKIELYGYYSAYDHVGLAWLWGKMIDLPKSFPMLTIDLKQMIDEKAQWMILNAPTHPESQGKGKEWLLQEFKKFGNYPKQTNAHNALSDARFNRDLHNFIKSL